MVASFDIDRGPVMEHQYPGAISPDENMLAELMLPDQTHVRTQDWTMFFLHKDANIGEDELAEREERREQRRERRLAKAEAVANGVPEDEQDEDLIADESSSDEEEEEDNRDGPPLMYVLNLVNTKHDASVKRGAIVKAMAICTRHPFLHIYKPLLLLALEDYFKSPYPETLEVLYNAVNEMDLSLMPRLSLLERHIMQASDTKDMFVEKFEDMIRQRLEAEAASGKPIEQPESPSRQSGRYAVPRDTHEFESKIIYNGIPVPVKIPTALSPETVGDFSIVKLIQIFGNPHTTQPQPFALHPHLTTSGAFTHPIVVLINALLTQKRVIFLAHNQPSGEVAEAVLGACALASGGVLRGFTRFAFPYTDLTKIDELLKVPGFIAGVTNPAFSYHPEWWDLLCDIPSGRIKISPNIEAATITEGVTYFQQNGHSVKDNSHDPSGDSAFMDDVSRSIAARHGESIVRAKFRAYISKFTRIAAAFEETVYGASALSVIAPTEVEESSPSTPNATKSAKDLEQESSTYLKGHGYVWPSEDAKHRELAASAARVEGWRNSRSYYTFISDLASHTPNKPTSPTSPVSMTNMLAAKPLTPYLDIYHALSRLRTLRLLPIEAGAIYMALNAYCIDYDSISELLEMAPMSEAGLFYVSLGLWHEERRVREAVAELLDRIRVHAAGKHFYARLGGWVSMGFMRCMQEREARQTAKDDEIEVSMMDGMRRRNNGRFN